VGDATSPSSGTVFATVSQADAADVDQAVRSAREAASSWAGRSAFERSELLAGVAAIVRDRSRQLAEALTEDQGKPLVSEARDEVDELVRYFEMASQDATRLHGELMPSASPERRALTLRLPLGVVGVVTPWNWPYTMMAELVAPALAAGNTVVWVPAPTTSACSSLLAAAIVDGLPKGVFSYLPGPGPVVGAAVVGHPGVDGVGFIGSIATGQEVARRASGKAQILELGGNGPMVVLDDADMELATDAALEAAYLCAGQSCTAGERFLVHARVRQEFVERVVAATAERVRLGDPFDPATTMGPLNNEPTAKKFDRHVSQAVASGARVCCGGRRSTDFPTSLYAEATVIDGVTPEMLIASEETFGPVVPVIEVRSASEALELTNRSPYGLTVSIFTEDLEQGLAFAESARAGWVNVNASTNYWEPHLPFGGRSGSASGRGRVGGRCVLDAFTEAKTVILPAPRPLWRDSHPTGESTSDG
jgi:acyl-CoA reductase-like NAD-dependent aldehyde dehydrogenase